MKHSKALALFLSVLCLLSFFLVGSHATGTASSDTKIISYEEMGELEKSLIEKYCPQDIGKKVEVVTLPLSKTRSSGNGRMSFNVLVSIEGVGIRYYQGVTHESFIDVGALLSQINSCFYIGREDVTFSNLQEINLSWEFLLAYNGTNSRPNANMDVEVFSYNASNDYSTPLYKVNANPSGANSSFYSLDFKPTENFSGPLVILQRNYRGGINHWYYVNLFGFRISWDTTENKLTSKISGFFGDLGDKISNWFNSLKEWIKAIPDTINKMITSVGDWFKEIGEKITSTVQDIKDWFINLFTIPEGFAEEYKAKWDVFLKKHFGFLYEVVDIIGGIFSRISTGLNSDRHYMVFPEIKVPFFDKVIVEKQLFCYEDFISSNSIFNYIYKTYLIGVWGYFVFAFIQLSQKRYDKIMGVEE